MANFSFQTFAGMEMLLGGVFVRKDFEESLIQIKLRFTFKKLFEFML